ncbi:MAG TPA: hypothetical protein VGM22_24295 [Methylomirabilota bacterium]
MKYVDETGRREYLTVPCTPADKERWYEGAGRPRLGFAPIVRALLDEKFGGAARKPRAKGKLKPSARGSRHKRRRRAKRSRHSTG